MSQRFFESLDSVLDSGLSDDELAREFEQAMQRLIAASDAAGEGDEPGEVDLDPADIAAIRRCAREGGPKSRVQAVNVLVWDGLCSWDDLEAWSLDPDEDVRDEVVSNAPYAPTKDMVESDKPRWVALLAEAAGRYPDDSEPIFEMLNLAVDDNDMLDLTWDAADRLFEVNDPNLNSMLIVCYFEHVIPKLNLGPEDKHIQPWIAGVDTWRQIILLKVATWMGLDDGRLRDIVEALTRVKDEEIRSLATGVLEGRLGYADV